MKATIQRIENIIEEKGRIIYYIENVKTPVVVLSNEKKCNIDDYVVYLDNGLVLYGLCETDLSKWYGKLYSGKDMTRFFKPTEC